jgi:hypothetical protein
LKAHTKRPDKTQSISILPLFSWRPVVVQPSTRAGQYLVRRHGIAPGVADLIASFAGLGEVR